MNVELLRFMNRRVRIRKDISHQEYTVLGIDWSNDHILLSTDKGILPVHHNELNIIHEETDDD